MIALDTNLLVYAHRSATPEHKRARAAIERAAASSGWGIAAAVVAEFWSVVTHPAAGGRPSTAAEARGFLSASPTPARRCGLPAPASDCVWRNSPRISTSAVIASATCRLRCAHSKAVPVSCGATTRDSSRSRDCGWSSRLR